MNNVAENAGERPSLLVVDDDTDLLASYRKILRRAGYDVQLADNGAEAFDMVREHAPAIVLTDVRMPRMDGATLTRELATNYPDTIVIVMTAYGTVERAVETMKDGAFDFLTKPFSAEQLLDVVRKAESRVEIIRRNRSLSSDLAAVGAHDGIIGTSPVMDAMFEQVSAAANSNGSVLILGESGTGKELVAKAIHAHSARSGGNFVALNCGALPEHLVESELFGHEKGAFTGAHEARPGLLETADNGVFFLDEIGDLPLHLQPKLLRAIEERVVRKIGGRREKPLDVRLLSATNRDVTGLVAEGGLREDLYYRLNTFTINVPPLRERGGDAALLAMHFLTTFGSSTGRGVVDGFTDDALELLTSYNWPGNVRQLQHVIERAVAVAGDDLIDVCDLPHDIRVNAASAVDSRCDSDDMPLENDDANLWELPLPEARQRVLDSFESRYLVRLLNKHDGNMRQASQSLGMERKSLYRLLQRHSIDPNDYRT
jgi:two-component system, NtrC family, response regulator AtoC